MPKPWEMDWKQAPQTQESAKPWEMDWKQAPAKEDLSVGAVVSGAVKNFIPSAQKFAGGVAQAIIHPVESAKGLGLAALGAVNDDELSVLHGLLDRINPVFAKQAKDVKNAVVDDFLSRWGSPENLLRSIKNDPVAVSADISSFLGATGAARAGTAIAAKGATMGGTTGKVVTTIGKAVEKAPKALNPMEANVVAGGALKKAGNALAKAGAPKGVANTAGGVGNVVNWLGPEKPMNALAEVAGGGVAAVKNAFAPKERAFLTALEGEGKAVADLVKDRIKKGEVEIVPSSKPTIAEAVSDLKLTKLAQFDQAAKKHLSTQAARRQMANEAAQMDHIGLVAKTEGDLNFTKKERSRIADPVYERAKKQIAEADKELLTILNRPSMADVMNRAKNIAAEKGLDFQLGENTPAQIVQPKTTKSTVLGPDGKPVEFTEPGYVIPAKFAKYTGENLHVIKMAFDDLIKDIKAKFQPGVESEELKAIYGTRQKFLDWVEKADKIPDYKVARLMYEENSKPIDRMLLGQYLKEGLEPVHGEDAAVLRSTVFENRIKDAPRTVKISTGKKHVEKLEDVLLPEEMEIVNQIRDDLRRMKLNERLAKFGRGNDPDLKKMATDAVGDATPPNLMNTTITTARALFAGLKDKFDQRLALQVATDLIAEDLNVPVAAIEKALAHELKVKTTKANVEKTGKAVGKALRTPAVYNMLAPQNENALSR